MVRALGFGRNSRYPQLCNPCFRQMGNLKGGAEVDITVLFADVRGSTGIAEQQSAAEFSRLLAGFYALATSAVQAEGGIVDKFLGDGVMALSIPSFTSRMDAARGVTAARRILAETSLPVGAGVNTGPAFTGFGRPSRSRSSTWWTPPADAHRTGRGRAPRQPNAAAETIAKAQFEPGGKGVDAWAVSSHRSDLPDQAVRGWALHIAARDAKAAA